MEKNTFTMGFTVGELKKWIEEFNVSDDAIIMLQRVYDMYFEKKGWKTVKKGGYWYHRLLEHNEKIDSGEFLDKEKYPLLIEKELRKYTQEELDNVMEEYYECHSPVHYTDEGDDKFLYLDAHY